MFFIYYEVPYLAVASYVGSKGYVCFCKTRAGNPACFSWFTKDILINFIDILKIEYDNDQNMFIFCDREKIAVKQIF